MAGRPREFDRDAALAKARDLFWARGYEGVSMADLVAELDLASARIYAAFGSKQALFREAVGQYQANEGGFARRALEEAPSARAAVERILMDAIELYTRDSNAPKGCMIVSAAVNFASENRAVRDLLADHRRAQTAALIARFQQAVSEGELEPDADAEALGDFVALALHGLSVQARDGVSRERLRATIPMVMAAL